MIKFLDLKKITDSFQPELGRVIARVVDSGSFVRGKEVQHFEQDYAGFIGTRYCVGVGNGFDALRLILKSYIHLGSMRPGDEIIVPANTYIASILAVTESGLKPLLIEPEWESFNIDPSKIEEAITPRTKAVMVVHLYGKNAMNADIRKICDRNRIKVIEDNAQAAGCRSGDIRTGALGDAAGHSFYPSKNLGALGDAGAVTTNDPALAEMVRDVGHYGSHKKFVNYLTGVNSRLDEVQAAVLSLKLARLDADNERRRHAARYYLTHISNPHVTLPVPHQDSSENVWHLFVIRCARRDALQKHLLEQGIETLIHYPIPPHRQDAYKKLNDLVFPVTERIHREVLSLPLSPVVEEHELRKVADAVNMFEG